MRYKRKPEEIDAMQLTKDNRKAVIEFCGGDKVVDKKWDPVNLHLVTIDGERVLIPFDYVIKTQGELEIMPREFFEMQYAKAVPNG